MGQSYLKNAALLTGADVLLRLAGMGLRIYLANALGRRGEWGVYQLVLAVVRALCHAGNGGGLGGGHPADGRGAGPEPGTGAGDAGAAGGHGAAAGCGGHGGAVRAGRGRCPVVAGRCAGSGRTAGVGLRDALDGPLGCAAGVRLSPGGGWSPTC